jgi:microcin C transport system ATP-binding protein
LAKLQQQYGLSMLIISHDLDVIAALSQRMLVLQQGQVVEQGEVAAIFVKPNHAYTKELLKHR